MLTQANIIHLQHRPCIQPLPELCAFQTRSLGNGSQTVPFTKHSCLLLFTPIREKMPSEVGNSLSDEMEISKKYWKVVRSGMRGISTSFLGITTQGKKSNSCNMGRSFILTCLAPCLSSRYNTEFLYAHRHLNSQITPFYKKGNSPRARRYVNTHNWPYKSQ